MRAAFWQVGRQMIRRAVRQPTCLSEHILMDIGLNLRLFSRLPRLSLGPNLFKTGSKTFFRPNSETFLDQIFQHRIRDRIPRPFLEQFVQDRIRDFLRPTSETFLDQLFQDRIQDFFQTKFQDFCKTKFSKTKFETIKSKQKSRDRDPAPD